MLDVLLLKNQSII